MGILGRWGKDERSSNSLNPLLAKEGIETKEKIRTVQADVTNPLTMRSVLKNAVQACWVLGGRPRIATRSTMATRHNTGRTRTRGASETFAHQGTTLANFGASRAGCSAEARVSATSAGLMTIFSIFIAGR
jgi:hypothetical protein